MLDWEEGLFRGGRALVDVFWTQRRNKPFKLAEVSLASVRMELFYFAHLLAGQRVSLFETDEALLRVGNRLCLPRNCALHTNPMLNREFYIVKTGLGALSLRDHATLSGMDESDRSKYFHELIRSEYPGFYATWQKQVAALPLEFASQNHFELIGSGPESGLTKTSGETDADESVSEKNKGFTDKDATEIEGKGRTQVEALVGEDLKAPDVPQHTFEKVETLEEFQGLDRQLDGADDIKDHQQALDELEMRHVLRSKDRAASLYRADIVMSPLELDCRIDKANQGIPYPEWDYRKKAYKEDWCWVQVSELDRRDEAWCETAQLKHGARIHGLKRRLSQFSTDYLRAHAQPSGTELDLEAVMDARIRMQTGGAPSENIYTYRRRDLSDVATLILVDLSDSTDAWVKGEHVLETLRGALFCLGEALEAYTHSFAIAGFASDTRRACRYFPIKDFDAPWHEAIPKLGGLAPQGYTRMGPIMRHATRLLDSRNARKKAVLLITDGRPCDYDTYEGRYGIQDVKKAFWEAREKGIITHAFAVDNKAREYFPAMFAPRNFSVIGDPKDLTDAIFRFFMTLKAEE
jgi:nitric oxide reductase NorD protein